MKSKIENPDLNLQKKLLNLFVNELNNLNEDKVVENLQARASIVYHGRRIGNNLHKDDKKDLKLFLNNPDNSEFSLENRANLFCRNRGKNITKREAVILDSLANLVTKPLIDSYDIKIVENPDEELLKQKKEIQNVSEQYKISLASFFELDKNYKVTSQTKKFAQDFGTNLFDKDFDDFFKSFGKLKKTSKEHPETAQAVNNLLSAISKGIKDKDITKNDLQEITEYLTDTTNLIKNYSDETLKKHNENIQKAIETNRPWGGKRPWGPIIGGALLCVSGILLVAAAVAVTVLTFGVSSPLTLPIATVGGVLTAAGLAFTGVVGLGVASKAVNFAYNAAKGTIADTMEEVRSSVEKTRDMKTRLTSSKNEDETDKENNILEI